MAIPDMTLGEKPSNREVVESVSTQRVGLSLPDNTGGHVLDLHGASGDRRSGLVQNDSDEVTVRRLSDGAVRPRQ